jgi:hypothetical protein
MSEASPEPAADHPAAVHDWQSAIAEFAASRIELIRLESEDAAQLAAQKTRDVILLTCAAVLGWLCLLAGLIGVLHHFTQWSWWCCALLFALIHAILAGIFAARLKRPGPPVFPLTRAEFHKDKLWMQSLKTPPSKH